MQATFKRPGIISAICILGFLGIGLSFASVFSPVIKKMGDWYPALFGLLVAGRFMSYIGLWHMKKWGAQWFVITFFLNTGLLIMLGIPSYISLVFNTLSFIPLTMHYKKMDRNL
jgi:hypothetical protein